MALPAAIQKQLEEAEEIHKAVYGNTEGAPAAAAAGGQAPAPGGEPPGNEPNGQVQPEDGLQAQYDQLQQRFRVLEGKYRAEVPRYTAQVRDLQEQIEQLKAQLAKAETNVDQGGKPPARSDSAGISQSDIDEYGEDMIALIKKASRAHELEEKVKNLEAKLGSLSTGISNLYAKNQSEFYEKLAEKVPDWETVNAAPEFHAWCAKFDPDTGRQHQAMLDEAAERLDYVTVAQLFNTWKQSAGRPSASDQGARRQPNLSEHVTPKKSNASTAQAASGGKTIWTEADMNAFYTDVRKGKYRGREDEAARIEADIFAAYNEDRVR
jgi:hypothetical protein